MSRIGSALIASFTLAFGSLAVADTPRAEATKTSSRPEVDKTIASWPAKPRAVAYQMIKKYGLPQGVTPTALVWHNNGPWKRTTVYREEVPHSFPKPHTDLLEQVIDARIPPDKVDELAKYDGSVHVHRTEGELSARCDMEEMNYLALNLANDVATGKKSVAAARAAYAQNVVEFMTGEKPPAYTQGLAFKPAPGANDPDKVTMPGAPQPATGSAASQKVDDAQVIAALITTNSNEVQLMHFVGMTSKDPKIQAFAATLKKHHAQGLMKAMQLGPQTKVQPIEAGPVLEMKEKADEGMAKLAALDGAAFDRAFVDMTIQGHERTLATIDNKLVPAATKPKVKAALTETRAAVAQHLQQAKQLQAGGAVSSR